MALNVQKGNMYGFVTHTWNTVKGACEHDCGYCYMKRWGKLNPVRFDESELRTDLGAGNFIFVGSGNDLFAAGIPKAWILKTLDHCAKYDNEYLFQSKNPARILEFIEHPIFSKNATVCTTIESDVFYPEFMGKAPAPKERIEAMRIISSWDVATNVTIEPVMKFNLTALGWLVGNCNPSQVNIGADSGHHHLPEPSKEELTELINSLGKFTKVNVKSNLKRLLK